MTPEQLQLLFTEGTQFDKNKLQAGGGSGLGLCITKEIVQQHGGSIEAQSEGRDMGTTFIIELPLREGLSDNETTYPQKSLEVQSVFSDDRTSQSGSTSPKDIHHHILVVDDVVTNSKMLVRLLERAGHTCVRANNGQEAVDAFLANQSDVDAPHFTTVLMDFGKCFCFSLLGTT